MKKSASASTYCQVTGFIKNVKKFKMCSLNYAYKTNRHFPIHWLRFILPKKAAAATMPTREKIRLAH